MANDDYKGNEIAIIGLACRFPKAKDARQFWENLQAGRDCISDFADEEILAAGIPPSVLSRPGFVKAGGVLEDTDLFDAAFFGFSPRESQATDPQHRVFLECAWEALENAGYNSESYRGATGVYAGMGTESYLWNVYRSGLLELVGHHRVMLGTGKDHLPMWASYKLNLTGPSINVNTACSTSLVAVHLAAQGLLNGECDMALAGGVTINTQQRAGYLFQEGGILSRDGRCRAFDAGASGTVSGNGIGIVVLKRLADALEDNDRIRAVIRGSAVNNDGSRKIGYTAPSIEGQAKVVAEALAVSEIDPGTISYVETHGTGTLVGDVVEIAALTQAFQSEGGSHQGTCFIGSVKSAIGHTDTAAGAAGLIKTVLALENGLLPPSLHFERPNPEIDFENGPFRVNAELRAWEANGTPRRAGVSSFGMGGTNAHVVLEEAPAVEPSGPSRPWQVLLLSAKTPTALEALRERLADLLATEGRDLPLADVAYTLAVGRRPFPHRLALVCRDTREAAAVLGEADSPGVFRAVAPGSPRPAVFLFSGQGSQYPGMARGLYESEPFFREQVDRGLGLLREERGLDLAAALFPEPGREEEASRALARTALAQPALFILEHALARLWMSWGISPQAMIGHSVGEYVAACLAEVIPFEQALRLVADRGTLMDRLPGGTMLSVTLPEEEVGPWLSSEVELAAVNGPLLCVLAGPPGAMEEVEARLRTAAIETRRLHTSHAFHSAMMEPVVEELGARIAALDLAPPRIPFVSNLTGTWITAAEATDPSYWARHLRQTVRFAQGIETLLPGDPLFLEIGPGRTLGTLVRQTAKARGRQAAVLSSVRHPNDEAADEAFLLESLGRLWLAGAPVDWPALYADQRRLRVPLPTYPFERKRYWVDAAPLPAPRSGASASEGLETAATPAAALSVEARASLGGTYAPPRSPIERGIAELWGRLLGIDRVGLHDSFFELGGHSLLLVQVVAGLRDLFGVGLPVGEVAAAQTVAELAMVVERHAGDTTVPQSELPVLVLDPGRRHEPFPLTEVQEAYWLGRSGAFALGGVATHEYFEYQTEGVDVGRLTTAWRRLIQRHEMLRAIVLPDGRQRILEEVPDYEIEVEDLRGLSPELVGERLAAIRRRMSHQVLPADRWPLFELRISRLSGALYQLHVSIDLLILDAWSVQILIDELVLLYFSPAAGLPPLTVSFRDYLLAEVAFRESETYRRSLEYWRGRLATLPPAPDLPLAQDPATIAKPHFQRRGGTLDPERWRRLKARAGKAGITPSAVPLAAFAEVLALWSKSPRFLINLTLFNRQPIHPQVDRIVGDFTSLILLEVDASQRGSFEARAQRLQRQFWQDLEHRVVSGVRVLRELTRGQAGGGRSALAPVVFTSTLNMRPAAGEEAAPTGGQQGGLLGENVFGISQTPQVWIDQAVAEANGYLVFGWDIVEDLFPPGLMDAMFAAYCDLLQRLADEEEAWTAPDLELLPGSHRALYEAANATAAPVPAELLHQGFFAWADRAPERTAVIAADRTLSYGELARRSRALAHRLRKLGARPNQLVAVVMEKGWEQVVAVLAVLEAGAAYLPVSAGLPPERIAHLLRKGEAAIALTQPWIADRLPWPDGVLPLIVDGGDPGEDPGPLAPAQEAGDLAYVIFTSGSTGDPKGVMIDHRGALNTVVDVNERFGVGPEDRVFGISSLSFDLSVWDIFGAFMAGSALVLPEPGATREPARWAEWLATAGVTVWNSVPALMEMLAEQLGGRPEIPGRLRLVLMSGDWIPVGLPDRIRELWPEVEVISMGGATEASIWSILYPIGPVDSAWRSIPYGRAMVNQSFHVLDDLLEPRPVWVPGQLYIGGIGLAQGYWRDPDKTAASFVVHPRTGERLYRTGDLGRWLPEGEIEFLGREDLQVKIQGYRIELGEIEAALTQHPALRAAVVKAVGAPRGGKRLVAYVVPEQEIAPPPEPSPGADGGAAAGIDLLVAPLARLEFKSRHEGLRRDLQGPTVDLRDGAAAPEELRPYLLRRSFRKFLREPIARERLAGLLRALGPVEWSGRLKYRYPSAGSLYPVQTYLYVKPGRVSGLAAGTYYYDPLGHRLIALSAEPDLDGRLFGSDNRPVFEESAVVLFLISQYKAVAPIYGARARDFSLLEAGYMSQLLMSAAPDLELGLCPVGGIEPGPLRSRLALEESHELLHLLLLGGIDREQALSESGEADDYELFQRLLREDAPAALTVPTEPAVPAGSTAAEVAEDVRGFLRQKLPEYMIPVAFMVLPALPLSANGKVDRKALPDPDLGDLEAPQARVAPRSALEAELAEIWAQVLGIEEPGVLDNFFELGGQSLLAARLVARVREAFAAELPLASLFEAPTIAGMAAALESRRPGSAAAPVAAALPEVRPDPERRHEPFPLTDLQYAYWVGGAGAFELGNLPPLYYAEIELKDLDVDRLARALRRLLERHEMLRAVVRPDGTQQIPERIPEVALDVTDLAELPPAGRQASLEDLRQAMTQAFGDGPLFRVRISRLDVARYRVHMAVSLLICDAWSSGLLNRELRQLYASPAAPLSPLAISFRDYILAVGTLEGTPEFQRALDYWRRRLPTLPGPPELPLAKSSSAVSRPHFVRRSFRLAPEAWRRLKARAAEASLTPDAVLCAVYAEVVATWSKQRRFVLTVLYFNRLPLHPEVESLLGNFSSTLLLEIDFRAPVSFRERARRVQEQLWTDIEHSLFGGVRVLRELNRAQGKAPRAAVPVVFASTIGLGRNDSREVPERAVMEDDLVESRLQTPQVWLDHQTHEIQNTLQANWDALDELFPPGLVQDMFDSYCGLLEAIGGEDGAAWSEPVLQILPAPQMARREEANRTDAPVPEGLLHDALARQAALSPGAPAVIAPTRTLSYGELDRTSNRLGRQLHDLGAEPGRVVGIAMEKGWEQAVGAFGVLRSGAAYLPLDPALPRERLHYLLERCGVELVVTQPWVEPALDWPSGVRRLLVDAGLAEGEVGPLPAPQSPGDLAYVIFTSGSTGLPKGVMIEHRAALNTIVDVNRRFGVGPADRILALSALSFDLSVYDLFGAIEAGGAVVIPEAEQSREPARLVEWMARAGVTVWDSVPALMEMLVDHLEARSELLPESLRLVLMSGDWIPVHLPGRIAALQPGARVISMGGATEASIWSILHPIERVDSSRPSIPYGRPMLNQRYHVLDERLEPCPDWTPGQLYIGGVGLARGYWGDEDRTQASFLRHPRTGERLYRTGDLGRWRPDGEIEFLGREDFQVKIQGYRIELGEIEAALAHHPGVRSAVALALGEKLGHKRLVAFVMPARAEEPPSPEELRHALQERLPAYMVPSAFVLLGELPLSANGKVDRGALAQMGASGAAGGRAVRPPRDEVEIGLLRIWEEVLAASPIGIDEDFFELGGDSVLAVRLMGQIQREFGRDLPLATLFESGTIERLADLLAGERGTVTGGALVRIRPNGEQPPFFCVHPVGGSVLCYVELARQLGAERPFYGLQVPVTPGLSTADRVETMAARYLAAIREAQPSGPYRIGGWSMGGVIAFEMARQLEAEGEKVVQLVMIDVPRPHHESDATEPDPAALAAWFARDLAALAGREVRVEADELRASGDPEAWLGLVLDRCRAAGALSPDIGADELRRHFKVFQANALALARYVPQPWSGGARLFQADEGIAAGGGPEGWEALLRGGSRLEKVPGNHYSVMKEPHVQALGERLRAALEEGEPGPS